MLQIKGKKIVEKRFYTMLNFNIIVEGLMILLGLLLLFMPNLSNKIIGILIGILLLAYALSLAYNYFKRDGAKIYSLNLILAILIGIVAILLIIYPYSVINFVTFALGIFFVISGATKINYALWLNRGNEESWFVLLGIAITLIILGLIIILNPFANIAITKVIGIFLIISSVLQISDAILFKKRATEIIKIFW